MSLVPSKQTLT